ncbi:MAG: hypothetical protein HQM03_10995 [Magnetococcales bacterium]|nr:hypothetical protein [Magnetococcales bacterium]
MANTDNRNNQGEEPVPGMQQLLDNPFLLLAIGVLSPTVLYTLWGVVEIISIPTVTQ